MAAGEDLRTLGFHDTERITAQMARTRFKKLAKDAHPDRPNGDKEQFQRLQAAFLRVLRALEAETRSPEGSTHCMSCYMAVMDAWREKKEEGVAGQVWVTLKRTQLLMNPFQRPRYCGSTPCSLCGAFNARRSPKAGQTKSPERQTNDGRRRKSQGLFWPL